MCGQAASHRGRPLQHACVVRHSILAADGAGSTGVVGQNGFSAASTTSVRKPHKPMWGEEARPAGSTCQSTLMVQCWDKHSRRPQTTGASWLNPRVQRVANREIPFKGSDACIAARDLFAQEGHPQRTSADYLHPRLRWSFPRSDCVV